MSALSDAGLDPCMLDIELTESCLIEDEHSAIELIKQFRKLGARVHLDDFGTGYSRCRSWRASRWTRSSWTPASCGVNENPVSQALARAIVAVARTLELKVIAEGVETSEETAFLDTPGRGCKAGLSVRQAHAGGRVHRMAGAAASAAPDRLSACAGSPGACTRPPPRGRSMHGGFHAGLRPGGAAPVLRTTSRSM